MADVGTEPAALPVPAPSKKRRAAAAPKVKAADPEVEVAKPKDPPKPKVDKKAAPTPTNPPTAFMVKEAIKKLAERNGSSLVAIKKSIAEAHNVEDIQALATYIKRYLRKAVESGELVQTTGHGASGSFKLPSKEKAGEKPTNNLAIDTKAPGTQVAKDDAERNTSAADRNPESPQVEEVDVPPEGFVYERGLVWEVAPPPTASGNTGRGILRVTGSAKRKATFDVEEGQQDSEMEQAPSKKGNHNISFSEEPHHVRYFHKIPNRKTPKRRTIRQRNLSKPDVPTLPGIRRKSLTKQNAITPWNPRDALANLPPNEVRREDTPRNEERDDRLPARSETSVKGMFDGAAGILGPPPQRQGSDVMIRELFRMNLEFQETMAQNLNESFSLIEHEGNSQGFDPPPSPQAQAQAAGGAEGLSIVATNASEHGGVETQDVLGHDSLAEEQVFENVETGNYGNACLYPGLIDCEDPITPEVIEKLAQPIVRNALRNIFDSIGIRTIGDLSRQTETDVIKWPLIRPKYETIMEFLKEYHARANLEEAREVDAVDVLIQANMVENGVKDPAPTPLSATATTHERQKAETAPAVPKNAMPTGSANIKRGHNKGKEDEAPAPANFQSAEVRRHNMEFLKAREEDEAPAPVNFESAEVRRQVMEFLKAGEIPAQEFLHNCLDQDDLAESILKILIERNDFHKRFWNVSTSKQFFSKPPMGLCDYILTQKAKEKYHDLFKEMMTGRIPQDFWRNTLTLLVENFAETYRENMEAGGEDGAAGAGLGLEWDHELVNRLQMETWAKFLESTGLRGGELPTAQNDSIRAQADVMDRLPAPAQAQQGPEAEMNKKEATESILKSFNSMSKDDLANLFLTMFYRARGDK